MRYACQVTLLSGCLVLLTAIAIPATAANLFYNQPLLPLMGESFGLSGGSMILVPSASKMGYAKASLLISPWGDSLAELVSDMVVLDSGVFAGKIPKSGSYVSIEPGAQGRMDATLHARILLCYRIREAALFVIRVSTCSTADTRNYGPL